MRPLRASLRAGGVLTVIVLAIWGLLHVPLGRTVIDRDGYSRTPCLGCLLFPWMEATFRPTDIKSIQPFSIQIASSSLNNTGSITSVTTTNTVLLTNTTGCENDNSTGGAGSNYAYASLSSATVVAVTRGVAGSGVCLQKGVAIEFYTGVLKSLQTVSVSIASATSNTTAIASVTPTKTLIFNAGSTYNDASATQYSDTHISLAVTSATVVTGTRKGSGSIIATAYGYAAEFY